MSQGRRFGKYLLHDKLAVGGMGELFLATKVGAMRGTPPSVLKILLPEYTSDRDFVSMFHDEARIGMQLGHPNIVAVQDLGRVGDTPYLVLEYVHGENLRNVQNALEDEGQRIPPETMLRIAVEVLRGLDHAHRAKDGRGKPMNLVHRDLSPDNIMLSFDGDVKLLDFGIAKAEGRATHTQFGILKGKVQYMAPEQALGWPVDGRTDLYAVGLVVHELLTGERRFEHELDPVQQIREARSWTPRDPSKIDRTLPVELDAIVLKALQAAADKRFQSANEFLSALQALLESGQVPRAKERLPAMMRRLFPDRAEPFLVTDDTASGARVERHAPEPAAVAAPPEEAPTHPRARETVPSDPVMKGEIPDEHQLLGAFLSRGKPAGDDRTAPEAFVRGAAAKKLEVTAPGVRASAAEATNVAAPPGGERTNVGAPPSEETTHGGDSELATEEGTALGAGGSVTGPALADPTHVGLPPEPSLTAPGPVESTVIRPGSGARRAAARPELVTSPGGEKTTIGRSPFDEDPTAPPPSPKTLTTEAPRRGGYLAGAVAGLLVIGLAGAAWAFRDELPAPARDRIEAVAMRLRPSGTPTAVPAVPTATPDLTPEVQPMTAGSSGDPAE